MKTGDLPGGAGARGLIMALAGGAALASTPALGQGVPPGAVTAPPTREELEPVQAPPELPRPRLSIAGDIERAPCPLADAQFADVRVPIGNVVFNNLKGATEAEMRAAWAPYAGTEQPVSVICEIRDAAATILRDRGYLAAVQVPTQRIENGEVRLEVLYARVTAVRARGQTAGAEGMIARYLGKLAEDEIFDRRRAERYLLLARDIPGYNVQLTLKPAGTGPGELIGEVVVLSRPYTLDFTIQNLAARDTGRWGGQFRAQLFGLTGLGDATTVSVYSTSDLEEQAIFQAGHEFRIGSEGLVLSGQITLAETRPDIGDAAGGARLEAGTTFATLAARYPVIRSQVQNLYLSGGMDLVEQDVRLAPGARLSTDKLRVAFVRLDADAIDLSGVRPRWRLSGHLEVRKGLDLFGASNACNGACPADGSGPSRADGDPFGTVLRAGASGEVALGEVASFVLSERAQFAFDPLLSFEEFSAGNYTNGRGYDPGTLIGDHGVGVTAELRGPRLRLNGDSSLQAQPYAFVDAAWSWNEDVSDRFDPSRLVSVGGGVRAEWGDKARLDLLVAVPTERAGLQARRGDTRVLLSFTTRILPWSFN